MDYLESSLLQIEKEEVKAQNIYQKVFVMYGIDLWLQILLKTEFTQSEFLSIIHKAQPIFQKSMLCSFEMAQFLYPNYASKTIDVIYENHPAKAFVNMKASHYEEELESYQENAQFFERELTVDSLKGLKPHVNYVYVLTLDGKIVYSELQDFDWILLNKDVKVLKSPNHALLAKNSPIMAAGEFIVLANDQFKIFQISSTSGHYAADYTTIKYMVKKLEEYGIEKDTIVTSQFLIPSIPWKFVRKSGS